MKNSAHLLVVSEDGSEVQRVLGPRSFGRERVLHQVGSADSLRAALAGRRWSAVITSGRMNGLSALDVVRIASEFQARVPVLVVGGGPELGAAAMRAGAADYLNAEEVWRLSFALERELERAEELEAVREAALRDRSILDTLPDAVLLLDLRGRIRGANRQAARLLGCGSTDALLDRRMLDFVAPAELLRARRTLQELIARRTLSDLGATLQTRDGTLVPVDWSGSLTLDGDGRPRIVLVGRDPKEQRQQALRHELEDAVERVLAQPSTWSELGPKMLQVMSEVLGWDGGIVWGVERDGTPFALGEWHRDGLDEEVLGRVRRHGEEGPHPILWARARSTGAPVWIADLASEEGGGGWPAAGCAVPLLDGQRLVALIELHRSSVHERRGQMEGTLAGVAARMVRVLERTVISARVAPRAALSARRAPARDADLTPVPVPPSSAPVVLLAVYRGDERNAVRELLESVGCVVLEAPHGERALAMAEQHRGPIHLLVTDVVMPELGGSELARRLQAVHPRLQVLYLAGYANAAGSVNGSTATLPRPLNPDVLLGKIRETLASGSS